MLRARQDRRAPSGGARVWVWAAWVALFALGSAGLGAAPQEGGDAPPAAAGSLEPAPRESEEPAKPEPPAAPVSAVAAKLEGTGLVQLEEAAALRAEADERIKALEAPENAPADPSAKQAAKALGEVLADRTRLLGDFDKVAKEMEDLSSLENNPDRILSEAKAEADRLEARDAQPIDALLPAVFTQDDGLDDAEREQMKEAIEGVRNEIRDFQEKLDATSADAAKDSKASLSALRGDRDKIAQRIAALKAKADAAATAPAPKTPADRKLADDRAVNLRVETTVETLRLQIVEMKLARAGKLAEAAELNRRNWIAHVRFSHKLLERMQMRHRALTEADERELKRKAGAEEANAKRARDPVERYRAGRQAELLDLEARAVNMERELASSPSPSLEQQRGLANRAAKEFADVKELLGGEARLSRLDAIRLNVDYRRIGPERDRIRREELARVEKQFSDHAGVLAAVELELIEDSMVDQVGLDNLLDKLPPERHDEAQRVVEELETRHRDLLTRQRDALQKLCDRGVETLDQIQRRLGILDDQYSYIRTQIFWIRDQEPLGATTLQRGANEFRRFVRASIGLARETANVASWKSLSPEFYALAFLCLVFPLGVLRVRGVVKRELARVLPVEVPKTEPHNSAVMVDMTPAGR